MLAVALLCSPAQAVAAPAVKVLLVDGKNNHNWRATTPVLVDILRAAGRFDIEVATADKPAEFRPDFSKYDVVVTNYNGANWPEATRTSFVDFVSGGGGLVVVHAADNSFGSWKEYNEMIGLGGWGGRNEKSGPMVYFKGDELVVDESPGGGGTHGAYHAFQMRSRDPAHPIMAGLPERWLHAPDELYAKMRGPAKNMKILATAFSAPKTGGTGRDEPQLLTVAFGKGRVFHTMLGHDDRSMRCVGFAFTLQRGTEWAATGKVTLTQVPDDFQTADRVSVWRSPANFAAVGSYDFGKSRKALAAIEASLVGASDAYLRNAEAKLLEVLAASDSTYAGKQFAFRMLRRIGSARSVPGVARFLTDLKLSHFARLTLQHLPVPEATAALRDALGRTHGDLRIGIIGSLGLRGDPSIVRDLAAYLTHKHTATALAAVKALGRVGGAEAAAALTNAKVVAPSLPRARSNALLACADSLRAAGSDAEKVRAIYRVVADSGDSGPVVRLAAYRGVLLMERGTAVGAVVELLDSDEPALRDGAVGLLGSVSGSDVTKAAADRLASLAPPTQIRLIGALIERRDKTAYPAVLAAASHDDAAVRVAALEALGTLGGDECVGLLAMRSLLDGDEGTAAFGSLTAVRGEGTTPAITRLVRHRRPGIRVKAIQALVTRHDAESVPAILLAAKDSEKTVREAAYDALGVLVGIDKLDAVTAMYLESDDAGERARLERAIRDAAGRLDDKSATAGVVVAALQRADTSHQPALLGVLPILSTDDALVAAQARLGAKDDAVAMAAVNALVAWRDPAPLPDLLRLAKDGEHPARQAAAIKGYTRLLSLPAQRPSPATVSMLAEAIDIAPSVEQKRQILAKLADFPCKEALDLAESMATDAELGATAKASAAKIKGIMLASGLIATASHGGNETKNAFDGNQGSRWTTGTPMRPGMWFMVDLGLEQTIVKIILDSRNSPGDYPRGCEVFVSADGQSWGKPVLTSKPQRPVTRLNFPKPMRGRFVKIVQTGRTDGLYWSIHEMRIDVE